MKNSVIKNYVYNLTYQILVLILPLITTPYISRVLGAENIGIYSYTISIATYFILFGSLGIALYGQREIAYNQNNKTKYSEIFWEIVILKTLTTAISMIIFYLTFAKEGQYNVYYRILLLEIIGNCIDISWFFQGLEEFKKTVTRNMIIKIISVICIFMFVKNVNDLYIYFYIYVLSTFVGNGLLWFYLPKFLTKVSFKNLKIFRHLKPTLVLFVPQIAIQVYTLLDRTMVGTIISDKSEVGYYDQAQKIVKILLTVITSMGTVMLPRIANTFATGNEEKVKKYMYKSFNLVYVLAFPIILGIISVSRTFVPAFFGTGYDKVSMLINVISPIILLIGLSNVTGIQYLLPTKRQKEYNISVVCGAVVNFIMNSIFIYKLGALGASIGTVIAEFTVTTIQIMYVRKDFNLLKIFKLSRNYLFSAIIMFVCCYLMNFMKLPNILDVVVKVVIGGVVYVVVLLIMKDEFLNEMLNKIMSKVKGKMRHLG